MFSPLETGPMKFGSARRSSPHMPLLPPSWRCARLAAAETERAARNGEGADQRLSESYKGPIFPLAGTCHTYVGRRSGPISATLMFRFPRRSGSLLRRTAISAWRAPATMPKKQAWPGYTGKQGTFWRSFSPAVRSVRRSVDLAPLQVTIANSSKARRAAVRPRGRNTGGSRNWRRDGRG